jgi:hypothetical protein
MQRAHEPYVFCSYVNLQPEMIEKVVLHLHADCNKPQCSSQVSAPVSRLELAVTQLRLHCHSSLQFLRLLAFLSSSYPQVFAPVARHATTPTISSVPTYRSHVFFSNVTIDVAFKSFMDLKRRTFSQRTFWAGIEM